MLKDVSFRLAPKQRCRQFGRQSGMLVVGHTDTFFPNPISRFLPCSLSLSHGLGLDN